MLKVSIGTTANPGTIVLDADGPGAVEYEARHPVGGLAHHFLDDHAAHRQPHRVRAFDPGRIEHGHGVAAVLDPEELESLLHGAAQPVRERRMRRAAREAVQAPLAARIDQSETAQRLGDQIPAGPLAARQQPRLPETIQLQLIPQLAGQPASPPLALTMHLQSAEPDLYHVAIQGRRRAVFRKQRDLRRGILILVDHLDRSAPGGLLRVVDLAEVEHLSLHDPTSRHPPVLNHVPVAVFLAVFLAPCAP